MTKLASSILLLKPRTLNWPFSWLHIFTEYFQKCVCPQTTFLYEYGKPPWLNVTLSLSKEGSSLWKQSLWVTYYTNKSLFFLFSLWKHQDVNSQMKTQFLSNLYCTSNRFKYFGVNVCYYYSLTVRGSPVFSIVYIIPEYVYSRYILVSVKSGFAMLGIFWFSGLKQTSTFWLLK